MKWNTNRKNRKQIDCSESLKLKLVENLNFIYLEFEQFRQFRFPPSPDIKNVILINRPCPYITYKVICF